MKPTIQEDPRLFLQQELVRRCKENPQYSLRAFARHLGMEASFLSKILRGERRLSPKVLQKISPKLSLGPREFEQLVQAAEKKKSNTQAEISQLTADQFQMIADWYHYAILELIGIPGFKSNAKSIAKSLGISQAEAQAALERLERLERIEQQNGGWKNISGNNSTVSNPFTNIAFRKLQKGVLEKAITAMEDIPIEERDQSSITIAIDQELLPEAKKRIQKFRRELAEWLAKNSEGKQNRVYHISTSLYPVSQKENP